jgi:bacteriophage HK97-gp10 putative tail-component
VTAVAIKGLAALQRRLALVPAPKELRRVVLQEAQAIAAEARNHAPGELGESVEVKDVSRGTRLAYAIGTPEPAGHYLEYGTARRHATPWLMPAFRGRLPRIKHALGRMVATALRSSGRNH